jgi:hypothetical protein
MSTTAGVPPAARSMSPRPETGPVEPGPEGWSDYFDVYTWELGPEAPEASDQVEPPAVQPVRPREQTATSHQPEATSHRSFS